MRKDIPRVNFRRYTPGDDFQNFHAEQHEETIHREGDDRLLVVAGLRLGVFDGVRHEMLVLIHLRGLQNERRVSSRIRRLVRLQG